MTRTFPSSSISPMASALSLPREASIWRASKGSRQSTRCGRNDVVQRGRARCRQADIETLRKAGWSDRAILDATLIASYFSFVNRIALTLGVELEGRFVHEASQR
jgi:alkylhydroperoxidase family enzyme